jgi:CRP-like cAMP-binding protein
MSIFSEWFPELGDVWAQGQITQAFTDLEEFELPDGRQLLFEGDINSDVMFYIVSGKIRVTVGGDGGEELLLNVLGPGNFVGEMGFLQGAARCAALTAEGDTRLKVLGREELRTLLVGTSPVILLLLDQLIDRLRAMSTLAAQSSTEADDVQAAIREYMG